MDPHEHESDLAALAERHGERIVKSLIQVLGRTPTEEDLDRFYIYLAKAVEDQCD